MKTLIFALAALAIFVSTADTAAAQPTNQSRYYEYLHGAVTRDTLDRTTYLDTPWYRPTTTNGLLHRVYIRIVSGVTDTVKVYRRSVTGGAGGTTRDTSTVVPLMVYQPMIASTIDTSGAATMKPLIGSAKHYAQFRVYEMWITDYFYIDFGAFLKDGTAYIDIITEE